MKKFIIIFLTIFLVGCSNKESIVKKVDSEVERETIEVNKIDKISSSVSISIIDYESNEELKVVSDKDILNKLIDKLYNAKKVTKEDIIPSIGAKYTLNFIDINDNILLTLNLHTPVNSSNFISFPNDTQLYFVDYLLKDVDI